MVPTQVELAVAHEFSLITCLPDLCAAPGMRLMVVQAQFYRRSAGPRYMEMMMIPIYYPVTV